jgi:protein involved in polysaccharide export with SLBB domain
MLRPTVLLCLLVLPLAAQAQLGVPVQPWPTTPPPGSTSGAPSSSTSTGTSTGATSFGTAAPAPSGVAPPSTAGALFPRLQPQPSQQAGSNGPSDQSGNPPPDQSQAAPVLPGGIQPFDYSVNLRSEVFGATMFTGAFARSSASIFNPDHIVAVGDQLQLRLWGAYTFNAMLTTDPQGNIFLPQVGPVRVGGVANRDLPQVLDEAVRRTFKSNVYSYISLAAAQPVRVFVTGFVYRPGMYQGSSTDSILRYLDQAGGIDPDRGSFLEVQVLRGSLVRGRFNLYDFLLSGILPGVQLGDGDVIVVAPRKSTFLVGGLAENAKRFEFTGSSIDLPRLAALAKPMPSATHVRVLRNTGVVMNTEYYPLSEVSSVQLANGDQIQLTADKRPGTITVRVEGEHTSPQEYVLPYGSRMGEVMKQIRFTDRADQGNLQLFRLSAQARQGALLQSALRNLDQAVLTARSGTGEEAQLRKAEADLITSWTQRARNITPLGQIVIAQAKQRDDLLLENGDLIRVPIKDGLVQIQGEVMFATAVAYDDELDLEAYIKRAGGFSQNADTSRIVIAHRDGSFTDSREDARMRPGDDVLVLPKVDDKNRQFWKDVTQIIFQIAVAARVVLGAI